MKLLVTFLKTKVLVVIFFVLSMLILAGIFALYQLPLRSLIYPLSICFFLGLVLLICEFFREKKRHEIYQQYLNLTAEMIEDLPNPATITEKDAQDLITHLCEEEQDSHKLAERRYGDMVDYYSTWVHQIKTPIAAMRLKLQGEDSLLSRDLLRDLGRIENYVAMVLTYIRLDSNSTDYVIREYGLDDIIKPVVRKFANDFILKKLRLKYEPVNFTVLTDAKWLGFVMEQILSNAVKYTDRGEICIEIEVPGVLCISDTGVGIAPNDLPRIFDNGFTGFNGRIDKQSTGIGLYLCKRICHNLGHPISVDSVPGKGTKVYINLQRAELSLE